VDVIRHAVFRGQVQGVGFRAFVEREAAQHDIEGWVRNRRDGTVEAVFAGSAEAWSKPSSPPAARVHGRVGSMASISATSAPSSWRCAAQNYSRCCRRLEAGISPLVPAKAGT
jgi:hypothetical protein